MNAAFLFWVALISVAAMTPIVWPLLRARNDDAARVVRKQHDALAAARAAQGILPVVVGG